MKKDLATMTDRPAASCDDGVPPFPLSIVRTATVPAAGHPADKILRNLIEHHSKNIDNLDFEVTPLEPAPSNPFLWLKGLMP
jgi:hypothetical protein